MSEANWYPDPTQPGRLRYWDGDAWTEHVSVNGEVASDPLPGASGATAPAAGGPPSNASPSATPPAAMPTDAAQAGHAREPDAVAAVASPPGRRQLGELLRDAGPGGSTLLGRAGFLLAALGGVVTLFTTGKTAVEQTSPFPATISIGDGAWMGIVLIVVAVLGVLSPWIWGRLAAIVIVWMGALFFSLAVIGLRTDDIFASGSDVSLRSGGVLLALGSLLLYAGAAIALWGMRVPVRQAVAAAVARPRKGMALTALICGIAGLLQIPAAPAAVAFGVVAGDDDRASNGGSGGRGMAIAGIVLGIISMAAWGIGLAIAMFVASP
ncbi:MAG TPA: DUF2510 domain-containing protein [Miltoncostaeaceae bacterium]|nr:DUF2510 domain-containing protein [Miltoncostaeaceae bacterium]